MHLLHLESDTDPRVEGDDGAPWRVIEEVGYGCSASKEFFQEVLGQQRLGAMDEGELAARRRDRAHAELSERHVVRRGASIAVRGDGRRPAAPAAESSDVNLDVVVDALAAAAPRLDWTPRWRTWTTRASRA